MLLRRLLAVLLRLRFAVGSFKPPSGLLVMLMLLLLFTPLLLLLLLPSAFSCCVPLATAARGHSSASSICRARVDRALFPLSGCGS